jgi:hypothetical protein
MATDNTDHNAKPFCDECLKDFIPHAAHDERQGQIAGISGDVIQAAQSTLLHVQNEYRDHQLPFWALRVAWEAARFAWYVTQGDLGTARDKLQLVEDAIADFKRRPVR